MVEAANEVPTLQWAGSLAVGIKRDAEELRNSLTLPSRGPR